MTTPINPISPGIRPVGLDQTRADRAGTTGDAGESAGAVNNAGDFASAVGNAVRDGLDRVAGLENAVTEASQKAATGDLQSVTDYMIATTEAQLATEITVAVRDRAVNAFNDIMRMQV